MPKRRRAVSLALALTGAVLVVPAGTRASAPDPPSNFSANPPCASAASCLAAAITVLDQARTRLSEPAYHLPANFSQLGADEQAFVLTNMDRTLYGLPPITGLTGQLDQAAATAVRTDTDPAISAPGITTSSANWAGGYRNLPLAYEAWMYDDGPGGVNLDCTALTSSGCWAHRHDVLWSFSGSGPLAMGAAAGTDPRGATGYALLIVQGDSSYHPDYLYTWSQALASGAGAAQDSGGAAGPAGAAPPQPRTANAARAAFRITGLRTRRHTLRFRVTARSGAVVDCSLTRTRAAGSRVFKRCGPGVAYRHLRPGVYRLRVRAGGMILRRTIPIR